MSWPSRKNFRLGSQSDVTPPTTPTEKCQTPPTKSSLKSSSAGNMKNSENSEVVKRGSLYIKRPPTSNPVDRLRSGIKTWQKRHLVLRDTWTEEGDTVLELHTAEPNNSSSEYSSSSSNGTAAGDIYVVNLRTVTMVEPFSQSKTFSYAFIVFRGEKTPLVFGAKTELEMKEWLMAIKLLADKVNHHLRNSSSRQPPNGPVRSISCSSSSSVTVSLPGGSKGHNSPPSVADLEPRLASQNVGKRSSSLPQQPGSQNDHGAVQQLRPRVLPGSGSPLNVAVNQSINQGPQTPERPPSLRASQSPVDAAVTGSASFKMKIKPTSDSERHNLTGDVILTVCDDVITLCRDDQPDDVILSWPLIYIRKLKSESCSDTDGDVVTLQATSQAGSAEGTYLFLAVAGCKLIQKVRCRSFELDRRICSTKRPLPPEPGMLPTHQEEVLTTCVQTNGTPTNTRKHCSSIENITESIQTTDGSNRTVVRTSRVTSATVQQRFVTSSSSTSNSSWSRSRSATDLLKESPLKAVCEGAVSNGSSYSTSQQHNDVTRSSQREVVKNQFLLPARASDVTRSTGSLAIIDGQNTDRPPIVGGVSVRSRTFAPPVPPPRPVHTMVD